MSQAGEEEEAMNADQSPARPSDDPLSSSISNLSVSSSDIPTEKDFHLFYNFDEFKVPIQQISEESQGLLGFIGSYTQIWGIETGFPECDFEDCYDWLVSLNDKLFQRFDVSAIEFERMRTREEECGKQKVSFHVPTLRKPQVEYSIVVDNSNKPFEHVWLKKSEDGQRFIHPLEKLSVLDFVDKDIGDVEPMKPSSLDCTPFKFVERVKDLKELAAKLDSVNEFAVDLEHNQYRSFQGLTCLMQISTRTEDFVVDTLKLHAHVGPCLREVFKDPTKRKVLHGADRDVIWLQQDFGIYICNMFDTGQASRVLKLERNSLEYLLQHYCGVTANKQYQNADWRLRPLPDVMVKYAREDTHYLLYIYDLMRIKLFSLSNESEDADAPLLEVYKRSFDLCMQLYEKELLTENSYLNIHGLQEARFNAQQLAVVAGLYEWRDAIARAADESTGYILPNKILLEIAKQMPVTPNKLQRLVKSKNSYVERNLSSVVTIIRHSMLNGSAFEAAAEHLRQLYMETVSKQNALVNDRLEVHPPDSTAQLRTVSISVANAVNGNKRPLSLRCSTSEQVSVRKGGSSELPRDNGRVNFGISKLPSRVLTRPAQSNDSSTKATRATAQELKKPNHTVGALLGASTSKRKFDTDKKVKEEIKFEQIRSAVKLEQEGPSRAVEILHPEEPSAVPVTCTSDPDIIMIDDDSDMDSEEGNLEIKKEQSEIDSQGMALELEKEDSPMSQPKPVQEGSSRASISMHPEEPSPVPVASTNTNEIIMIDDDSDSESSSWDLD